MKDVLYTYDDYFRSGWLIGNNEILKYHNNCTITEEEIIQAGTMRGKY